MRHIKMSSEKAHATSQNGCGYPGDGASHFESSKPSSGGGGGTVKSGVTSVYKLLFKIKRGKDTKRLTTSEPHYLDDTTQSTVTTTTASAGSKSKSRFPSRGRKPRKRDNAAAAAVETYVTTDGAVVPVPQESSTKTRRSLSSSAKKVLSSKTKRGKSHGPAGSSESRMTPADLSVLTHSSSVSEHVMRSSSMLDDSVAGGAMMMPAAAHTVHGASVDHGGVSVSAVSPASYNMSADMSRLTISGPVRAEEAPSSSSHRERVEAQGPTRNSLSSSAKNLLKKRSRRSSSVPPSFKTVDKNKPVDDFNADDYIDIAGSSQAQIVVGKSSSRSLIRRSHSVEDMPTKSLTRRLRGSSVGKRREEREPNASPTDSHLNEAMANSDQYVLDYDTNASTRSVPEQRHPASLPSSTAPSPISPSQMHSTKHQFTIPPITQTLTNARICSFLSLSTEPAIQQFIRLSRLTLEGLQHTSPSPMLTSLLQCGEDVVLEDRFYFQEGVGGRESGATVAILRGGLREVIVCYCGSREEQEVCVRERRTQTRLKSDAKSMCYFNTGTQVPIHPHFNKTYFSSNVETRLFTRLKEIITTHSISNVVFTGHSFGAALSTIGSVRFAGSHPTLLVSCILFGAPKVGGVAFRSVANSMGNLKIIRLEHGNDFSPALPEGPEWHHVGHTITLAITPPSSTKQKHNRSSSELNHSPLAMAYLFDQKRPGRRMSGWNVKKTKTKKHDHDVSSYVHAIETFNHMGIPWVDKFVGYDVVEEGRNGEEARIPANDAEARYVL